MAENNYLVKVEKKHIEAGRRSDAYACPVALAIRDAIPSLKEVKVYQYWTINIKLNIARKSISLKPPYWLSERIDDYDNWGTMDPFSFTIDLYRNKIFPEYEEA